MSDAAAVAGLARWNCNISTPEQVTVGTEFELRCAGPAVDGLSTNTLSLELAKPDRYRLRILENKSTSTSEVHLVVTSYTAGENKIEGAILTDGIARIELSPLRFQITSVLKQDDPQQKPFPPESPVGLAWPASALFGIGLFVFAVLGVIALFVRHRRAGARFEAWLEANQTPLSPFDQLNKDMRHASRERDPARQLAELEQAVRWYLVRLLEDSKLRLHERSLIHSREGRSRRPVSGEKIWRMLKRRSRGDRRVEDRLRPLTIRLMGELDRVSTMMLAPVKGESTVEASRVTLQQVFELHEMVREFATEIELQRTRGKLRVGRVKARRAPRGAK
ncbi:MAG: hypothetical protein RBT63_00080 [Bdellovibrionales bacterium]|jgi:hypothetical protein|nr:hypothetical protein [Bdellovibrionales bacterium]